jgi:type I restriction enzyme M protein
MSSRKRPEVLYADTSINVSKEVAHIWSIANTLRGAYKSDKYKDVIIPMIIIRRLECALNKTKAAVVQEYATNKNTPESRLKKLSGFDFYNTSKYTLDELLNNSKNMAVNFESYIEGFSFAK